MDRRLKYTIAPIHPAAKTNISSKILGLFVSYPEIFLSNEK